MEHYRMGTLLCKPPRTYLFIELPEEVDLVSQPFQARLQLYLVHVSFIHILGVRRGDSELRPTSNPNVTP